MSRAPKHLPYRPMRRSSASLDRLNGRSHWHSCTRCRRPYTDGCFEADTNACCSECRDERKQPRPLWEVHMDPGDCCRQFGACQQVKGDNILRYALGGPGPWFKCSTCARCHPFLPNKEM